MIGGLQEETPLPEDCMFAPLIGLSLSMLAVAEDAQAPPAPSAQPPLPLAEPVDWIRGCLGTERSDTAVASCTGRWGNLCQEQAERMPTVGISGCIAKELSAWESLRLEVYEKLVESAIDYDRHMREGGPSVRASLAASKVAWEAFRDAQCDYEWAEYADGTMRGIVGVSCQVQVTSQRYDFHLQHGWSQNHFESFGDARVVKP